MVWRNWPENLHDVLKLYYLLPGMLSGSWSISDFSSSSWLKLCDSLFFVALNLWHIYGCSRLESRTENILFNLYIFWPGRARLMKFMTKPESLLKIWPVDIPKKLKYQTLGLVLITITILFQNFTHDYIFMKL